MATSKLQIANGSLRLLKERLLTQAELTGGTREPARNFNSAWVDAVDDCLEAGQWKFARRTVMLDATTSQATTFGVEYAYRHPEDLVRLAGMWGDANMNQPTDAYRDEGGYWYSSLPVLYASYISNDPAFGGDLSLWTAGFTRFVQVHIAAEIAGPLTSQGEELYRLRKQVLTEALSTDAMADPTRTLPVGSWVRARRSNFRGREQ